MATGHPANRPAPRIGVVLRLAAAIVGGAAMLAPTTAFAQRPDGWEVNLAPLYISGSRISGDLFINDATVPVSVSFDDAIPCARHRYGFVADAAGVPSGTVSTNFDVAHYGPIVAFNLRWGGR